MTTLSSLPEVTGDVLNANDVATQYRLPIQTVWRMTREGRLKGSRVTSKITLYRRDDVERALGLSD